MINFMFGIHNHQPVGNFEGVFKHAYESCYLPFIQILQKYPKVRMSLHYTGPLLEWIEKNHPEYFDQLREMISRKQIELMGGGFYEPLLPVIPHRDALGQIKMMQEYIQSRFNVMPRGMWLAERVWEPLLPSIIAEAGLEYAAIDDTHFYYAGFKAEDMYDYYITEDQGEKISVFPIDKELRYLIPFSAAEKAIAYLKSVPEGSGVTLADDGEKFGLWPGTHKWVYSEGYLETLFRLLAENEDDIRMLTFSEFLDSHPPRGKVFLPTSSYDEMMEWSLPVDSQIKFKQIVEEYKNINRYSEMRPYLRGGFWRNFLVKYPESNKMYSKMIRVSQLINDNTSGNNPAPAVNLSPEKEKAALKELYRGQCNCAYWHGLFGGIYLNYLRHAIYEHLIEAENIVSEKATAEQKDYNFDGFSEILFSAPDISLYLSPDLGGQIVELDYRPKRFCLTNLLTRRPEAYHGKLKEAKEKSGNQPQSIHDGMSTKEEGLENILFYDWYQRNNLVDHILDRETCLDNFSRSQYGEKGDFVNKPYKVISVKGLSAELERQGRICDDGNVYQFVVRKNIAIKNGVNIVYTLKNLERVDNPVWFGIEFNFTLLAGDASDRYYSFPEKGILHEKMNTKSELHKVSQILLTDKYTGFRVKMEWPEADILWRFPVETVSHSEGGVERTYQGSCIMPSWKLNFRPGEEKKLKLSINMGEDK